MLFPYMEKVLQSDKRWKQLFVCGVGMGTFIYSSFLFFGKDIINIQSSNKWIVAIVPVYRAYLIILLIIVMAYAFRKAKCVASIGRNTLYLCGNEYIIKTFLTSFFSMLGLTISICNPLAAYMYAAILVLGANYILIPVEKPVLNTITEKVKAGYVYIQLQIQKIKKEIIYAKNNEAEI